MNAVFYCIITIRCVVFQLVGVILLQSYMEDAVIFINLY